MKIGIMQPYFLPYIGYWQLMNVVDKYVIFDDVNFINRGWINRNRILVNGIPKYINVNLSSASQNKLINQIEIIKSRDFLNKKLRMLELSYKKAPYYQDIYPMVKEILSIQESNLAVFIRESFLPIMEYLDIDTELIFSSEIEKDNTLKGQEKILKICEDLGATEYYNAIGGQELYTYSKFKEKGIELKFLKADSIEYRQFENEFVPNLSIIDVLMFNTKETVKKMLMEYSIIKNDREGQKYEY